jgi:hypothetical protein
MKRLGIVFNHDEREYLVYPEFEDGVIHQKSIDFYQKQGVNVVLTIRDAAENDTAIQEAEAMNATYHYHRVTDTLGRYIQ